jgi:hypothetical protein
LQRAGRDVIGIGKVEDLFSGAGLTASDHTTSNAAGMRATLNQAREAPAGAFVFTNLNDFDTLWGHRNDPRGYAAGLQAFDAWLPELLAALRPDDILVVTSDHGNDPTTPSTDHSREYVPVLALRAGARDPQPIGVRHGLADIAATFLEHQDLPSQFGGTSLPGRPGEADGARLHDSDRDRELIDVGAGAPAPCAQSTEVQGGADAARAAAISMPAAMSRMILWCVGITAERGATMQAVAAGMRPGDPEAVAIFTSSKGPDAAAHVQVLVEFGRDVEVLLAGPGKLRRTHFGGSVPGAVHELKRRGRGGVDGFGRAAAPAARSAPQPASSGVRRGGRRAPAAMRVALAPITAASRSRKRS